MFKLMIKYKVRIIGGPMLLRNRERHSRSKFGLAIFAILSLVFVGTFAIISRTSADDAYWTVPGIVRGIKADATPDCSNGHSGWETASTYENSCFYKKYNDLGALGAFNLIGLSEIRNNVRINGNVVTKRLDSNQILGVSEWPEINYVRDYFNATTGFFQNSADSIVAFGSAINIENDVIGKYVEKLMQPQETPKENVSRITMDFLKNNGF
jgi:hypothetical protein